MQKRILLAVADDRLTSQRATSIRRILEETGSYLVSTTSSEQFLPSASEVRPDVLILFLPEASHWFCEIGEEQLAAFRRLPEAADVSVFLLSFSVTEEQIRTRRLGDYPLLVPVPDFFEEILLATLDDRRSPPGQPCHGDAPTHLAFGLEASPPPGPNNFFFFRGRLHCQCNDGSGSEGMVCDPTSEQWQHFWQVCAEIDIWQWPISVGSPHGTDGLLYSLVLSIGSGRAESYGQIVGSPAGFRENVLRLHRTLQEMTGWKPAEQRDRQASPGLSVEIQETTKETLLFACWRPDLWGSLPQALQETGHYIVHRISDRIVEAAKEIQPDVLLLDLHGSDQTYMLSMLEAQECAQKLSVFLANTECDNDYAEIKRHRGYRILSPPFTPETVMAAIRQRRRPPQPALFLELNFHQAPPPGPNAFRLNHDRLFYSLNDYSTFAWQFHRVFEPNQEQLLEIANLCLDVANYSLPDTDRRFTSFADSDFRFGFKPGHQGIHPERYLSRRSPALSGDLLRLHQTLQTMVGWGRGPVRLLYLGPDTDSTRFVLSIFHGSREVQVAVVHDIDTALRLLEERSVDVMISEITVPGFDGFEAHRIIAHRYPALPFGYITEKFVFPKYPPRIDGLPAMSRSSGSSWPPFIKFVLSHFHQPLPK